jgi:hypothetical protein
VQPLAGVHVPAGGLDPQLVLGGEVRQRDAVLLAVPADVERLAVERCGRDGGTDEVDPAVGAGLRAPETDGRGGGEGLLAGLATAVGQVELDRVLDDVQQRGAPLGVGAGQVGRGHAGSRLLRVGWASDGWTQGDWLPIQPRGAGRCR